MLYLLYKALQDHLVDLRIDALFMILDQLAFRALAAAGLSFALVLVFGRPVIEWLRRKKIGDTGLTDAEALRHRANSKANIPTMGGVLIVGGIIVSVVLLADIRNFYIVLGLAALLCFAALGGIDDWLKLTAASRPGASRQGLHAWEKLLFQLGLGAMFAYFVFRNGDTPAPHDMGHVLNLPFQKSYIRDAAGVFHPSGGLFYLPLGAFVVIGMLMIAGMSNAVNITDGMDGLAAGSTAIVALGLVVLTAIAGDTIARTLLVPQVTESAELVILAAATAGASLGFLWWNCSPASVFMGDTGSLSLGAVLAYIAVVVRQEFLLLVMSGIFLLEIGSVVLQVSWFKYTRAKTGTGRRLFRVAPIHHHFHLLGWPEQQVVTRFWIITATLVIAALTLIKAR
ncbi:MAG: phospho-N-acetylmuramoyl-pentapeptide-transferase [Phycisphaeraceae bacterium]|nr:phospho-N-acetylmuramoyl-pentapeptide-transferase [Phycisphaeraceae bacterium]